MLAGLGRIYRALFYGSTGTLSMGRVLVALGVLQVFVSIQLFTLWIAYVTLTGQMTEASPLASSIGNVLAAVLSSQVASIAATWWTSKRYGDNGAASQAQVNDPHATAGASVVPAEPAPPVEAPADVSLDVTIKSDDPNNPGGI